MLTSEYDNLVSWLSKPYDTSMPMWKMLLVFVAFVIIGFIVVDNLDLIQKGLQA